MVLNESTSLTFEMVRNVTSHTFMDIAFVIAIGFPLLLYILFGIFKTARTPSGNYVYMGRIKARVIMTSGYWIGFGIFTLMALLIVFLIKYPVWLLAT